jgi:rfaE bifunctional protein nucleotidyltransferase chain/domain
MLVSLSDLPDIRSEHQQERIGFVVGTFDLFHIGHLDYLEWAWDHCDRLFVCVRSDARVKQAKGQDRPIFYETERARIVNSLKGTAFTHIANKFEDAAKPSIKVAAMLKPDIVILGNDWGHEAPIWRQSLNTSKSEIVICPMPWTKSTSRIINRIRYGR